MKKFYYSLSIFIIGYISYPILLRSALTNKSIFSQPINLAALNKQFTSPDKKLRYDQVSWLTAHSAYANKEEGFTIYYQQSMSIKKQLDYGARALMISTHLYNGDIYQCHGSCTGAKSFQYGITQGIKGMIGQNFERTTFAHTLITIKEWLENHPSEIVTILLQNYAPTKHIKDVIESVPGLSNLRLTTQDYNPLDHDGFWPTIDWLQKNNKRLIIFDDEEKDEHSHIFYIWNYAISNLFSTVDIQKVCTMRIIPFKTTHIAHRLYIFNYYGEITRFWAEHYNSYNHLSKVITMCLEKQKANNPKLPNFIAVDFIDQGDALAIVNMLNQAAR